MAKIINFYGDGRFAFPKDVARQEKENTERQNNVAYLRGEFEAIKELIECCWRVL